MVGAFLVVAAAVGVFAAYLNASAAPDTSWVVADQDIPFGARVTTSMFRTVPLDLPPSLAVSAIPESALAQLEGRQALGPIAADDLVTRTLFQAPSAPEGSATYSFSLPTARALAGDVVRGDLIDVIATYTSNDATFTSYIARSVPVLDIVSGDAGVVLTVAIADPELVLAVINALDTADVTIVRSDPDAGTTPPDFLDPAPRDAAEEREPAAPPVERTEPAEEPTPQETAPEEPAPEETAPPAETAPPEET